MQSCCVVFVGVCVCCKSTVEVAVSHNSQILKFSGFQTGGELENEVVKITVFVYGTTLVRNYSELNTPVQGLWTFGHSQPLGFHKFLARLLANYV